LPTAAVVASHAPPAAVDKPAPRLLKRASPAAATCPPRRCAPAWTSCRISDWSWTIPYHPTRRLRAAV